MGLGLDKAAPPAKAGGDGAPIGDELDISSPSVPEGVTILRALLFGGELRLMEDFNWNFVAPITSGWWYLGDAFPKPHTVNHAAIEWLFEDGFATTAERGTIIRITGGGISFLQSHNASLRAWAVRVARPGDLARVEKLIAKFRNEFGSFDAPPDKSGSGLADKSGSNEVAGTSAACQRRTELQGLRVPHRLDGGWYSGSRIRPDSGEGSFRRNAGSCRACRV